MTQNTAAALHQKGVTLIELLISMALGMVVIAALVYVYAAGSTATNNAKALGQMNEDGQMALAVITQELRNAGYNPKRSGGVVNDLGQGGWNIFACDTGFADASKPDVGTYPAPPHALDPLTCNASGSSAALAVVYEGDTVSGKLSTTDPTKLQDCIGNGVTQTPGAPNYYIMQSRLFISGNALRCLGSGDLSSNGKQGQVLAENIESMTLSFGVKDPTGVKPQAVYGYLPDPDTPTNTLANPSDANLSALSLVNRWNMVAAVRVCVVVMSETAVLGDLHQNGTNPTYVDCNGAFTDITDGKIRRAYRTTVILRNHGVGYADQ